jgi:isoamylase
MPVPTEHISDERLFGQRDVPATLRAGFEEMGSKLADPQEPLGTGRSFPLGATVLDEGVNFSVFSRQATRVDLLLFDDAAATQPTRVIELDARTHRTYHYWHVFVPGIRAGQIYAYRADGPFDPERGLRFDPSKALLDPYGRAVVVPDGYSRRMVSRHGQSNAIVMKSVVVDLDAYDWEGDAPPRRPFATTVI